MKKKSIIIGTGISIASIIGGYYLTRYGARKYIQNQEHKIVADNFEKIDSSSGSNRDKLIIEGILKMHYFRMKHKKLYKFAYGKSDRFEPRSQPFSL